VAQKAFYFMLTLFYCEWQRQWYTRLKDCELLLYLYSMMANSLLRSTSDFLASGIDKCLNQLYDCADMQSPERHCGASTECPRLNTSNTHASFERRFVPALCCWMAYFPAFLSPLWPWIHCLPWNGLEFSNTQTVPELFSEMGSRPWKVLNLARKPIRRLKEVDSKLTATAWTDDFL